MTKGIHQPPGSPFPPTIIEAEAVIAVGVMFAHIFIIVLMMILMIYYSKKVRNYPTIIIIYLFSLIIGFESFLHLHTPFSPMIEIFLVIFNTSLFIQSALDYNTLSKRKKGL